MTDLVGKTLGNYQIVEEIGRGGMAVVYKAWQASLNRYVALKVLPPYFQHHPEFLERFRREAQAAAQFNHPNIVSIYGTGEEAGLHYIVMEYLTGGSLHDRLGQGTLSLDEAERIVAEVGSALDYAHARGLVHRDIKPANILFTPEGVAKVTDFGIVRAADGTRITRTGVLLGTPEYMSPEQAEGEEVDWRTDLYALGVVLYQMVTGEVPFGGTTPHVVMHGVIYEAPRPPEEVVPGLPRALSGVLLKALAKVPGERFQSGGALAEAFVGARQGRTVVVPRSAREAGSPPTAETGGAATRGIPRTVWIVGAALAAVLLVVVLVLMAGGSNAAEVTATAQAGTHVAAARTATARPVTAGAEGETHEPEPSPPPPGPDDKVPATETAQARDWESQTATTEAAAWAATVTAIAAATDIDEAVKQTADALSTDLARDATGTAGAATNTPVPTATPWPSDTPRPTDTALPPTLVPTSTPTAPPPPPAASNWPAFRRTAGRTGQSPDGLKPPLRLAWAFDTGGSVVSSPAIVGKTVYVGSANGSVYAVDAATGAQRWAYRTGDQVLSSPAVAGGRVYVGSFDGHLYALQAQDGALLWRFHTGGKVFSSPAVVDGVVYVGSFGSGIFALDAASGAQRWSLSAGGQVPSSPAVADGVLYFSARNVQAVGAGGGQPRWAFGAGDGFWGSVAVAGGSAYVGGLDGNLYALDAATGQQRWAAGTGAKIGGSPAVAGGSVYLGSDSGNVYAFDAASGGQRWSFRAGGTVGSSPAVAGGVVYVGSESGTFYALAAKTGQELWRFQAGAGIGSSPAIGQGMVVVGSSDGKLYAFKP